MYRLVYIQTCIYFFSMACFICSVFLVNLTNDLCYENFLIFYCKCCRFTRTSTVCKIFTCSFLSAFPSPCLEMSVWIRQLSSCKRFLPPAPLPFLPLGCVYIWILAALIWVYVTSLRWPVLRAKSVQVVDCTSVYRNLW
jgi:hypothetical protein